MFKPKNAFYYFMQDFREDQKKKGIRYDNMAEVAVACDPLWKNATPEERRKYKEKADMDKKKKKDPEFIYYTSGVSVAELQRQEKQKKDAEIAEREIVKNLVKQMKCNGEIIEEDFFLIDVNYFCKHISNNYVMGESTVLQFSIKDGLKNKYHEVIHPGKIPIGYQSDVKLGAKEIGLDIPDERVPGSDYRQILAKLTQFLKQNNCKLATIPPLYTMPDNILVVRNFIQQMCFRAGVDVKNFRVYRLDALLYRLSNAVKSEFDDGIPTEHVALAHLRKGFSMFAPGTACEVHEEADRALACSEGRAKCLVYIVLKNCCPLAGVRMWPNSHLPPDPDLGTVQIPAYPPGLREHLLLIEQLGAPTNDVEMEQERLASVSNKPSLNSSYVAFNTWSAKNCLNSTVHFSSDSEDEADSPPQPSSPPPPPQPSSSPPPPQFTNREFLAGLGRGRGRHLVSILANVNLKK